MPDRAARLYVAVTPHGYGHLSMTGAVLDALRTRRPEVTVSLETTLPAPIVAARVAGPVTLVPETDDFGLAMVDSTALDPEASAARYRALHADWDAVVGRAARRMAAQAPDLVLSNVGYIALAAAHRLGVPALALGPFTWTEIYRHYFADRPEAAASLATMDAAYDGARAVLVAEGAMPLRDRPNRLPIGPVGAPGRACPDALRRDLGVDGAVRLALVTFGGVASGLDLAAWPRGTGWRWLVRGGVAADHPDAHDMDRLPDWTFPDILASCDAVVTKLGYGMTMECGLCQRPTLYLPRTDGWPEQPYLRDWLARHTPLRAVTAESLGSGAIVDDLAALLDQPVPGPAPRPTGAADAAAVIERLLDES
ncbi:hypothetical protein [Roseospira visakhapatnamensis]|uniref:Uncharacterized protein n=1 Tax=Roseospira visakhapatnamensis TaxID=390880 RepID=A0A7W6RCQ4_9PROT|nr:hypothetical protein [Roseospira visakhapatnamensis]MBB4266017.1 hypothetical protein [Roseospira visakhapatnamensis]